jgi:hypothetical protein
MEAENNYFNHKQDKRESAMKIILFEYALDETHSRIFP